MRSDGIISELLGYKIICTESCCDYVQVRKHKKKRTNKKWLKRYGKKYVPKKEIVITNCGRDKFIFCHPKYWDKFQQMLQRTVNEL
jgi:hypothetical protein